VVRWSGGTRGVLVRQWGGGGVSALWKGGRVAAVSDRAVEQHGVMALGVVAGRGRAYDGYLSSRARVF